MKCAYHPTVDAVGACVNCGRSVCGKCKVVLGEKFYCKPCAELSYSGMLQVGQPSKAAGRSEIGAAVAQNTSGWGNAAVIPNEIKDQWNWGAALLTWIWAIGNKVPLTWRSYFFYGEFIPAEIDDDVPISLRSLTLLPNLMFIMWARNGNEWAWKNKRWESIEHFKSTQRAWFMWGIGVYSFPIVIVGLLIGFFTVWGG